MDTWEFKALGPSGAPGPHWPETLVHHVSNLLCNLLIGPTWGQQKYLTVWNSEISVSNLPEIRNFPLGWAPDAPKWVYMGWDPLITY